MFSVDGNREHYSLLFQKNDARVILPVNARRFSTSSVFELLSMTQCLSPEIHVFLEALGWTKPILVRCASIN